MSDLRETVRERYAEAARSIGLRSNAISIRSGQRSCIRRATFSGW